MTSEGRYHRLHANPIRQVIGIVRAVDHGEYRALTAEAEAALAGYQGQLLRDVEEIARLQREVRELKRR